MSFDLVLRAWVEVRDAERARNHPAPEAIAQAAIDGPDMLEAGVREHLLTSRCDFCEGRLLEQWEYRPPSALLLALAEGWPGQSSLVGALAAYRIAHSDGAPVAAQISAVASLTDRLVAYFRNLGAEFLEVFDVTSGSFVPVAGLNDSTEQPRQELDAVAVLSPRPGVSNTVTLSIDFDLVARQSDGPAVVVVLHSQTQQPLAEVRFDPAVGPQTAELALDPSLLEANILMVAIGVCL